MKLLLCIDDTDNLESIGTGEVLENLCEDLKERGLGTGGFVTRHQLYIHEDIAYTSHNSSMCTAVTADDPEALVAFSRSYMDTSCAAGSDPGLCVLKLTEGEEYLPLKEFGQKAKVAVVKKQDAYDLAKTYEGSLWLSEHGGTGDGVIGAIAGIGLRLTGMDGRIKGKIIPEVDGEVLTVGEYMKKYAIEQVVDENGAAVPKEDQLRFFEATKAVFMNSLVTSTVKKEDGYWVPDRKKLKKRGQ
ncbi:MAG: hypothetical protein E7328_06325 [Clostridiales bacterium]|nr:hypothetical protein [Clostridiales bacterium]